MRVILKKMSQYEFILVYLILLFFSGYYFFEYWTVPGMLIIAGLLMIRIKRINSVQRKVGCVFLIMLFNIILTETITSFVYARYSVSQLMIGLSAVTLTIPFIFSQSTDYSSFKESFINCMIAIAIVSLVVFLLYQINPAIIKMFPVLVNSKGREGYFALFTIQSDFLTAGSQRNQGIFWEPGAFQVFLNLAYIFELSAKNRKPRKWVLILLLFAVITTYSTTGIIAAVALLAFTLSRRKGNANVIKAMLVLLVFGIASHYILPKLTGFWQYTLVRKISMLLNYQIGIVNDASSRVDSIIFPLEGFLKSPIYGMGKAGFSKMASDVGHSMFTFTPINWFACYGIIYGLLTVLGLWRFFRNSFFNTFETAVIMLIFLVSISSEALQGNMIIMTCCFLGYTYAVGQVNAADTESKSFTV